MLRCAIVVAVFVLGCGGKYGGGGGGTTPNTQTMKGGIGAAALPYQILDRNGHQVEEAAFWARLLRARAVCVGEEHPNPHHHWVQLRVVQEFGKRKGTKLALGMEMVQRPFQGPLDDYAAKRITADALRSRIGWEERWGYDWELYSPTIDTMVGFGGQLLALNAAKELTKKIVRQGLESLTADEKAQVPELKLDDPNHRAWFEALMADMGGSQAHSMKKDDEEGKDEKEPENPHKSPHGDAPEMPSAERIYTVQVVWDETMADVSAQWLKANPTGQLVILAGNGHCHDSAIVGRLKRRGIADVISVRPVIDAEGEVASVLAKPMNDYVVVLQMPPEAKEKTAAK